MEEYYSQSLLKQSFILSNICNNPSIKSIRPSSPFFRTNIFISQIIERNKTQYNNDQFYEYQPKNLQRIVQQFKQSRRHDLITDRTPKQQPQQIPYHIRKKNQKKRLLSLNKKKMNKSKKVSMNPFISKDQNMSIQLSIFSKPNDSKMQYYSFNDGLPTNDIFPATVTLEGKTMFFYKLRNKP